MDRSIRLGLLAVLAVVAACSSEPEERKRPPPLVKATPARQHLFVAAIEAEGTVRANEQVTIAAAVTERVERVLFDDAMPVRRGQLLAVLSQGQETATLRGANAAESQARAQYGRIRALSDRGFATRAQLDVQLAAAEKARADASEAQAAISDRLIRAPFSGVTGLRNISPGAVVSAGTPLVTVSDLSRVKLDFTVPETQLAGLALGQVVQATSAAYPGEAFSGRVASIDPVIDPSSRAAMVRAILPNPGARLKPGMLLSVRVERSSPQADAVPELAVVGNGEERAVFVVGPGNKAKRVVVKTGLRDGGFIEVTGLPAGARVIDEGVLKVTDGMAIRLPETKGKGGTVGTVARAP